MKYEDVKRDECPTLRISNEGEGAVLTVEMLDRLHARLTSPEYYANVERNRREQAEEADLLYQDVLRRIRGEQPVYDTEQLDRAIFFRYGIRLADYRWMIENVKDWKAE